MKEVNRSPLLLRLSRVTIYARIIAYITNTLADLSIFLVSLSSLPSAARLLIFRCWCSDLGLSFWVHMAIRLLLRSSPQSYFDWLCTTYSLFPFA